jgi:hypothetical protein
VAWLVSTHLKLIDVVDEEVLPAPPHIRNLLTCGWQERVRRNFGEKDGDLHCQERGPVVEIVLF